MSPCRTKISGFTLIEVISVLFILSVITAVVVSRIWNTETEVIAQAEVIKSHLRYAQTRAMSTNVKWGIDFTDTGYTLIKDSDDDGPDAADIKRLPGEGSDILAFTSGISVTPMTISFDYKGIPYIFSGGTYTEGGTVIDLGSDNPSITITQNTGFIP